MPPAVIAHRGSAATAPENTLAAVDAAWLAGADVLHVDLRLTADRRVVVLHDATVDATTDGTGPVETLELAEIRRLDAGSWFGAGFAGLGIPTLEEVLSRTELPHQRLLLHLHGPWTGLGAARLAVAVADAGLVRRTTVQSSDPESLAALAAAAPDLARALVVHRIDERLTAYCADLGVTHASLVGRLLVQHPGVVDRLHEAGIATVGWKLDEPALWARAVALGAQGIATAAPGRLRGWLASGISAAA